MISLLKLLPRGQTVRSQPLIVLKAPGPVRFLPLAPDLCVLWSQVQGVDASAPFSVRPGEPEALSSEGMVLRMCTGSTVTVVLAALPEYVL